MKMKAYISEDYDGRRQAMVAAANLKAAAVAFGATEQGLRDYGWRLAVGEDAELALSNPGQVYFKPIGKAEGASWIPDPRTSHTKA